jgi:hypothetical protein
LGARHEVAARRGSANTSVCARIRFRRTHRQALGAYARRAGRGPGGRATTSFEDVAPLALMSDSIELIRAWVVEILGALAAVGAVTRVR